jgi:hypothetical protein
MHVRAKVLLAEGSRLPIALTVLLAILMILMNGCAMETVRTYASTQADQIDERLSRDRSTKADVLLFLGEPDGAGESLLPPTHESREVWYYETHGGGLTSYTMKILLVYFRGDLYDGYMWFENRAQISFE